MLFRGVRGPLSRAVVGVHRVKKEVIFFISPFFVAVPKNKSGATLFFLGSWCPLQGVCALKILGRFWAVRGPKRVEDAKTNWGFPVLGAVSGKTPANQI